MWLCLRGKRGLGFSLILVECHFDTQPLFGGRGGGFVGVFARGAGERSSPLQGVRVDAIVFAVCCGRFCGEGAGELSSPLQGVRVDAIVSAVGRGRFCGEGAGERSSPLQGAPEPGGIGQLIRAVISRHGNLYGSALFPAPVAGCLARCF